MTTDSAAEAIICAVLLEVQVELDGGDLGELERAAKELRRLHAANLDSMEWYKAAKSQRDELLEALKAMLEVHGVTQEYADKHIEIPQSWVEVSNLSRAAIAKATGE